MHINETVRGKYLHARDSTVQVLYQEDSPARLFKTPNLRSRERSKSKSGVPRSHSEKRSQKSKIPNHLRHTPENHSTNCVKSPNQERRHLVFDTPDAKSEETQLKTQLDLEKKKVKELTKKYRIIESKLKSMSDQTSQQSLLEATRDNVPDIPQKRQNQFLEFQACQIEYERKIGELESQLQSKEAELYLEREKLQSVVKELEDKNELLVGLKDENISLFCNRNFF